MQGSAGMWTRPAPRAVSTNTPAKSQRCSTDYLRAHDALCKGLVPGESILGRLGEQYHGAVRGVEDKDRICIVVRSNGPVFGLPHPSTAQIDVPLWNPSFARIMNQDATAELEETLNKPPSSRLSLFKIAAVIQDLG
jgi:hypothetical protein